jgi:hypothetical protein
VLAPDALERAVAQRQFELADEAASAEGEQLLAQSHDLLFQFRRGFVGVMVRSAGVRDQAAQAVLLKTAEPLADRGHGGLEAASGGLDTDSARRLDQAQAMIESVFHFADQREVRGGHGDECNFAGGVF